MGQYCSSNPPPPKLFNPKFARSDLSLKKGVRPRFNFLTFATCSTGLGHTFLFPRSANNAYSGMLFLKSDKVEYRVPVLVHSMSKTGSPMPTVIMLCGVLASALLLPDPQKHPPFPGKLLRTEALVWTYHHICLFCCECCCL